MYQSWRLWLLLGLTILLAFVLRVYKVTEVPPSLNWDEVSIAYNAYSILTTGRDEWGNAFPVHFKAYGEYKLPAQIYASIPAIAVLGLNDFAVRITPVVYGTLTVLLIFFLGREMFKSRWTGLLAALFLAISPWHIQLTRASFESSFATFWIVLAMIFLVKGFTKKEWIIYSMIPFAISLYTYNTTRVFTPVFLIIILLLYFKDLIKFKRHLVMSGIVLVVLTIPLLPFFFSQDRNSRYKLVSITDDPGLVLRINEQRGLSNLPDPLPRLVHNKVTYISFYFIQNYLSHFTPDYLFVSGAPHKQHHVQNIGQFYLFQAPLLFIGLYYLRKEKNKFTKLLASWILLSFIPVAITQDSIPHALRTLIVNPAYQLIMAYGAIQIYELIKGLTITVKASFLLLSSLIVLFSVGSYLGNLFNVYSTNYSRDWQYGYKETVKYINEHYSEYDQIVFSRHYGEPHMFTLFYLQYDPEKYQNNPNLIRFETHDWVRVLRFDKFYFPDLGDNGTMYEDIISEYPNQKLLFIGKPGDFPDDIQELKSIDFLNGQPAFKIVSKQ